MVAIKQSSAGVLEEGNPQVLDLRIPEENACANIDFTVSVLRVGYYEYRLVTEAEDMVEYILGSSEL